MLTMPWSPSPSPSINEIVGGSSPGNNFATYAPIIAFLGVVLAAWVGARWKGRADERLEQRRRSILRFEESVTLISDVRAAFEELISVAPRGATDPEADARGAELFSIIFDCLEQIRRMIVWLRLIATKPVVRSFEAFESEVYKYLAEIDRQMTTDHVFRAVAGVNFINELSRLIDQYVDTLRKDMGLKAVSWPERPWQVHAAHPSAGHPDDNGVYSAATSETD